MLTQLIVTSVSAVSRRRGVARQIALAKPPQFHIKNKVNLIGFLGNDAEVRTANNRSFTTLSLATKSSYKDKKTNQYVSQTEWHRCVVFGNLSEFAGTLTKGAHVQVEGELRSREYSSNKSDSKQRIWEIRVSSILKLDRAEKASPDDQDREHASGEEPAF
jgi:single-strand DNA-binding protein